MSRVAVLGGGVAGLSAAHELATRGVDVTVFEARDRFGGKARSFPGPTDGAPLPAEHGFRFFPGFYRHLTATMERIPDGEGGSVADHLVAVPEMRQALVGGGRTLPTSAPTTLAGWRDRVADLFGGQDVPADETAFFTGRLLQLLTSSEDRWEAYDDVPWWAFVRAEEMSEGYRTHLAYGITQTLVAMRPERASTRTIGRIYLQLLQDIFAPDRDADRILDGPTSDVWLDPWVAFLEDEGVELRASTPVRAVESDGERVTGVRVGAGASDDRRVAFDQYVLAVPLGVARRLRTDALDAAAPSLRGLDDLDTAWMNGIQFYLSRDVSPAGGHVALLDSPWALTAISQREFWADYDFDAHPTVDGVLSVAISNFDAPGPDGRSAREHSRAELAEAVWRMVRDHVPELSDDDLVDWQVDPALSWDDDAGELRNADPLLINTVGSRRRRPDAETESPNLALAADYVRTHSDLASMENANEAGRRAANVVLDRLGVRAARAGVWSFDWPSFVEPLRAQDEFARQFGLPHPGQGSDVVWSGYRRLTNGLR